MNTNSLLVKGDFLRLGHPICTTPNATHQYRPVPYSARKIKPSLLLLLMNKRAEIGIYVQNLIYVQSQIVGR